MATFGDIIWPLLWIQADWGIEDKDQFLVLCPYDKQLERSRLVLTTTIVPGCKTQGTSSVYSAQHTLNILLIQQKVAINTWKIQFELSSILEKKIIPATETD